MKPVIRAFFAMLLATVAMAASAVEMPRFDQLERQLDIRPEQKEQFEMAVGATKRALLAVSLSAMEMKQRLAEELLKPNPDFSRLFEGADRVFEQHTPLFKEAAREWKKLYAQLDDKQVETVKRFLLDNLGGFGAAPFLEDRKEKGPKSREWI
jgi:hypothetical protein